MAGWLLEMDTFAFGGNRVATHQPLWRLSYRIPPTGSHFRISTYPSSHAVTVLQFAWSSQAGLSARMQS